MSKIKCSVKECIYHKGEECRASSIHVRPVRSNFMISSSDDTACETFKPRHG